MFLVLWDICEKIETHERWKTDKVTQIYFNHFSERVAGSWAKCQYRRWTRRWIAASKHSTFLSTVLLRVSFHPFNYRKFAVARVSASKHSVNIQREFSQVWILAWAQTFSKILVSFVLRKEETAGNSHISSWIIQGWLSISTPVGWLNSSNFSFKQWKSRDRVINPATIWNL